MKYLLVIGDGCADDPVPQLGNRTPLQTAHIPTMDRCAAHGTVGHVVNCPPPLAAGSETAILSILGCDPRQYFTGRSPMEAAALGIDLAPGDAAFRCNLVSLEEGDRPLQERRILSHSAGSIDGPAALETVDALLRDRRFQEALTTARMELHPVPAFRQLAVRHRDDTHAVEFFPPHDHLGEQAGAYLPQGPGAEIFIWIMELAAEILAHHPVTEKRRREGKLPANGLWIWARGEAMCLPSFREQYGKQGAVVSAVPLCQGIGVLRGLEMVEVPGATGELDTNFEGKLEATWDKLQQYNFVCLHLEAPDECTHNGDLNGKLQAIEWLDSRLVAPLLERLDGSGTAYRLLLLSDHKTLTSTRGHAGGPVPFLLYDSREDTHSGGAFDEPHGMAGPFVENGADLLDILFGSKALFSKARH